MTTISTLPGKLLLSVCLFTMVLVTSNLYALDLLSGIFSKEKVKSEIWDLNEQYVRLVQKENKSESNDHPVVVDAVEVQQALSSLQLWTEGGLLRDEEAIAVFPRKQAALIAGYVADALAKAAPDEDVTFNVRGYTDVMLSMVRRRQWTTGRVFFLDGKLNVIIGEHQKIIDKAKKNVEGAFGIIDDYRDVHFQVGSRYHKGKMQGRVVTTKGVKLGGDTAGRPDWIVIDTKKAALAYREAQVPPAIRKEELKAKAAAAKLTLERRQMREEMARMRKEIQDMQTTAGGSNPQPLEQRLATLQQLKDKGLISNEDYETRKDQILSEI